ncbi:MoaF C-terminal domain-containing protein [Psychromicrobium lacuslunae]|uniref:MoaF protein n=1 Tax=Psychromicrobium lacuslunae TaxID=1618207 RepID=A0A0D4BXX4_9MICC|nr:MoaF C-terminal domain-containing protein [Psychromicrobium lacuslunae]AJT41307.1 MoaF protein precursor [Psychromicrobium lacuslunae]
MTTQLTDTSNWLPLDGLAPGFDANKAAPVQDLAGTGYHLKLATGVQHFDFSADSLSWQLADGGKGEDSYETFAVAPQLYYVQWQHSSDPRLSSSLILDLAAGRSLYVGARLIDQSEIAPGRTGVSHQFLPGIIAGQQLSGEEMAPTQALIGRRVQWVYSEQHAYEHIYLSSQWYTWQCLAGPERGLADTDENTVYQLRPGIYLFSWREKVIPCGSITVADHRDVSAIRSHGALFGWDESGSLPVHFSFGAHGKLISVTIHPDPYEPAHWQL